MKGLIIVALLLIPTLASAQNCGNCGIVSSCCSYSYITCPSCNNDSNSFTTKHEWKVTKPGTLGLTGTKFTIKFVWTDWKYHLLWEDGEISAAASLADAKTRGIDQARDMQDAGVPLN